MNRLLVVLAMVFVLSFGFAASSHANAMAQNGFRTYDTTKLIGLTVKSRDGVELGRIFDLIVDSHGHADFAIVNQPGFDEFAGRMVVVPFKALTISKTKSNNISLVFNEDKERFYEGPDWGYEHLADPKQAASVDRYYGIQPYWTENGAAGGRRLKEFKSSDLVGTAVENSCGKVVGIINEVMVDSGGHSFAIVNYGDYDLYGESGVNTPVPLEELRISRIKGGQDVAVLKMDMEHFDLAPYFDPIKGIDRQREANIYEYYGIQPYWTESWASSK